MSFDAKVYFAAVPADLASRWQAALRDLGMSETALIPPDWEQRGAWYLLDQPTDKPEDSFAIEVGPLDAVELAQEEPAADEQALLSGARYVALVSTRLSAGSAALMAAGSLARATDGVVVEYQGAAFEEAFAADLAAHRGQRGPEGQPTLAERGYYDAKLAWQVARAASAYERRVNAKSGAAAAPSGSVKKIPLPSILLIGGLVLWAIYKLHKAGYF